MIKNFDVDWQHINVEKYTKNHMKKYTIEELIRMFSQKNDPKLAELAYLSFLAHSAWGLNFDFNRGVKRTNMQLRLPLYQGEGLSWTYRKLNPKRIWATEDSLDWHKHQMVKAAVNYIEETNRPLPPVVVWLIKHEGRYNYVCHDGHHRIYIYAKRNEYIPTILLEYWIDNREDPLLPKKLHYRKIDRLVKDMPIEKRTFHNES